MRQAAHGTPDSVVARTLEYALARAMFHDQRLESSLILMPCAVQMYGEVASI